MRRLTALPALLFAVAAGCQSATAADRAATAPAGASHTLAATTGGLATASVRPMVVGGLYVARGVTTGDAVHIEVRRQPVTSGFATLSSGTLVAEGIETGQAEVTFSPSGTGNRYLIIATPQEGGVLYPNRAQFVELIY